MILDKIKKIKKDRLQLIDKFFIQFIQDLYVIEHDNIFYYMKECIILIEYNTKTKNIKVDNDIWNKFEIYTEDRLDVYYLIPKLFEKYLIENSKPRIAYPIYTKKDTSYIPYLTDL